MPVRARHFDTPEKGDRAQCQAEREKAQQASTFARRLLPRGAAVALSDLGRDRYGRLLATVTLPDGTNIAVQMIGAGLARPYEGGRKQGGAPHLGRHDDQERGVPPRAGNGQAPGCARRRGPGCPENPQADRYAPCGFRELPRPAPDPCLCPLILRRGKGAPLDPRCRPDPDGGFEHENEATSRIIG